MPPNKTGLAVMAFFKPVARFINCHFYKQYALINFTGVLLTMLVFAGAIRVNSDSPQLMPNPPPAVSNLTVERPAMPDSGVAPAPEQNTGITADAMAAQSTLNKSPEATTLEIWNSTEAQNMLADYQNQLKAAQAQMAIMQSQAAVDRDGAGAVKQEVRLPQPFSSVREAQDWLDNHHLPVVLTAGQSGKIDLTHVRHDPLYDCDDYARDFQKLALESGYLVNYCPVVNGEVWGIKVTTLTETHIACWVQIGDTYYYIESVPGLDNSYKLTRITDAD